MTKEVKFFKNLYNNDSEFKEYIDKYSKQREIPINIALKHFQVKEYYKYLIDKRRGKNDNL